MPAPDVTLAEQCRIASGVPHRRQWELAPGVYIHLDMDGEYVLVFQLGLWSVDGRFSDRVDRMTIHKGRDGALVYGNDFEPPMGSLQALSTWARCHLRPHRETRWHQVPLVISIA